MVDSEITKQWFQLFAEEAFEIAEEAFEKKKKMTEKNAF